MMIKLLTENEDYEFIPIENNPDAWGIRVKAGKFIETVIMFGAIGFNEEGNNLTFNFDVISSPNSELTPDDKNLQEYCSKLLESIIMNGIEEGEIKV